MCFKNGKEKGKGVFWQNTLSGKYFPPNVCLKEESKGVLSKTNLVVKISHQMYVWKKKAKVLWAKKFGGKNLPPNVCLKEERKGVFSKTHLVVKISHQLCFSKKKVKVFLQNTFGGKWVGRMTNGQFLRPKLLKLLDTTEFRTK